ncbi:DUF4142 domain-containing protein [Phenylobacterium deserti]|uniref:DUF4142 domain-containing protein n=1 Tax=Phenylobacterium deserti TaxID=1914756 RepID=A0A328AU12_9CAUL|nr:DUF4142 domain-containing protein [Phenylobacterium deserti]RAK57711.1 hypothetical protein DJ018_07250 [Phenylobacterium deserti]
MSARFILLTLCSAAVLLGSCGRVPARGAEAAARVADAPRPAPVLIVSEPAPPPSDAEFVAAATAMEASEIAAAQSALARAADPRVKRFAGTILRDHQASRGGLAKAIAESGQPLAVSSAPPAAAGMEGSGRENFDAAFMAGQVEAHQQALARLQAYAQDGGNTALRAYAAGAAVLVQQHLAQAQQLAEQLG